MAMPVPVSMSYSSLMCETGVIHLWMYWWHMYKVNYQNKIFKKEMVELDGHSFKNCEFRECMIVLRTGDTELKSCHFENCRLILKDNALNIGKIITTFTGKGPLRVVDFDERGMFYPEEKQNHE